jgi:hypothetical protein
MDGDVILIQQGKYNRDGFVTMVGSVMLVMFKEHSVI